MSNLKEDYVSFEVAKLLKEKHFPQDRGSYNHIPYYDEYGNLYEDEQNHIKTHYCAAVAPTQQMAMRFIRECTNYEPHVYCSAVQENGQRLYSYYIYNVVDANEKSIQDHGFVAFEDAVDEMLLYALKNLKL